MNYTEYKVIDDNMVKNITIGISDELAKKMEEFNEVNWSAVARACIEKYITQRHSDYFEKAIAEVQSKKDIEFKKGFDFFLHRIERIDFNDLEYIADFKPTDPDDIECFDAYLIRLANEIEPFLDELKIKINSQFLYGMQSSAREIIKRSR